MTDPTTVLARLRELHEAATPGRWRRYEDADVKWDDPMACGWDSREHHRGPPYYCTGPRTPTSEQAERDSSAIVAMHASFSALLAVAEAAQKLQSAKALARELGSPESPFSASEERLRAIQAIGEADVGLTARLTALAQVRL